MSVRDITYLELIHSSIEMVLNYTDAKEEEIFLRDDILKDACLMRLTVIGEYGGKLSEGLKMKFSEVEWSQIKAARNFYVHAYDAIDWLKVWDVIKIDLPKLELQIKKVITEIDR